MKGANLFLRGGVHPRKTRIEPEKPENDGLEDEVPFPKGGLHSQVPAVNFRL